MRGIYARNLETAEAIRRHLEEARIPVLSVTEVNLLSEGMSLVPRRAVLVEIDPSELPGAAEAISEHAPELLEWCEDLSHLSPIPTKPKEEDEEAAPRPPAGRRSAWESDPQSWIDDIFSENADLSEAVLAWIARSSMPTAPQIGEALARAIREDRQDLVWPLCRALKPMVHDPFLKHGDADVHGNPLLEAKRERALGVAKVLRSLVELSCAPLPATRRGFCLAAGQIESETLLPALVSLLDDPEEEVRYEASGALYGIVHKDFGYDSESPVAERTAAVARWKEWLAKRYGGTSWSP